MLIITANVTIPDLEIEMSAIRAQGAGGQNVNKVSTAIHLRYDIKNSTLPEILKNRLLKLDDYRISSNGIVVIKAQRYRSQEQNRNDALLRLEALIKSVTVTPKRRKATRPSKSSQLKRLDSKTKHSALKKLRNKTID